MDIRQATVSWHSSWPLSPIEIEDLLGMQNANLLNLPENYTFKYCEVSSGAVLTEISITP